MEFLSTEWWAALAAIIGLNIVLAGDNAVVIAMASRKLAPTPKKQALLWGTVGAVVIRIICTFIAVWLLKIPFLMAVGGLLLIYVAIHLITGVNETDDKEAPISLASAIRTIIVADLIMGLDNVLAIAGASRGNLLLILIGLAISIPIVVFASQFVSMLMNKYPVFVYVGAAIIAYTAAAMFLEDPFIHEYISQKYHLIIEIATTVLVLVVGNWQSGKRRTKDVEEVV